MIKKFKLVFFVIMFVFMTNVCYAAQSTVEIERLCFGDEILEENKVHVLQGIENYTIDGVVWYNYKPQDRESSIVMRIKNSKKDVIENLYIKYGKTSTDENEYEKYTGAFFIDLKLSDIYQNNKVYTIEFCTTNTNNKEEVVASYKVKFDITPEEKHIYNPKTLKCDCGEKMTINVMAHPLGDHMDHYGEIENLKTVELMLIADSLCFEDENEKYSTLEFVVTSFGNEYRQTYTVNLDKYDRKNEGAIFNADGTTDYQNIYEYDFNLPKELPNGRTNFLFKIGGNVIYEYTVTVKNFWSVKISDFSDLNTSHWAYNEVMVLAQHGILNGYTDGNFKPEKEVTREEFLQMMYKANFMARDLKINFVDVDSNRWSYNPISKYGKSIAENKNNLLYFYPSKILTRQEAAKLLVISTYNYGNEYSELDENRIKTNYGQNFKKFTDRNEISEECEAYVYEAYNYGLMQGISNTIFSPSGTLTRAQAAALIYRIKYPNVIYNPNAEY